jgi:general secretion pathway protein E
MRQDPDIIMVGEIRDLATAEMAIQAALTGHLVLSTLHTNDAPSAVMRLELGVPAYLLEATLAASWRSAWCAACAPTASSRRRAGRRNGSLAGEWNCPAGHHLQAVGCPECRQTGYRGRTGLYELLTVTEAFSRRCARNRHPGAAPPERGRRHETAAHRRRAQDQA